jgi:hypothetical protein
MTTASRSLAEAGTTAAASTTGKAATEAGVNTAKGAENQRAEAKSQTDPLAGLPPHHLAVEAEVEAEAAVGNLALAQSPPATARVTHGNVLTNTDLTTSAQSASAG